MHRVVRMNATEGQEKGFTPTAERRLRRLLHERADPLPGADAVGRPDAASHSDAGPIEAQASSAGSGAR